MISPPGRVKYEKPKTHIRVCLVNIKSPVLIGGIKINDQIPGQMFVTDLSVLESAVRIEEKAGLLHISVGDM
jgi:hypothetical protein